jgi:uncharacterized protein YutE (UPF0331/DUF86 family)
MIRKDFVRRKISLIQDELAHLVELSRYSFNEIVSDFMKMSALERILERIISRAIDINNHLISELATKDTSPPKDFKETFMRLAELGLYSQEFADQISKSIGTRNVLVHEYDKVDQRKIYDSVSDCLRDYQKYCEYILEFVNKKPL